jgi:RES domain-containing protein
VRFNEKTLETLATLAGKPWEGEVYRHMFADIPPDRENTLGARWNPPELPAIYTSLARDVVIAESDYQIAMQPRRPKTRRTVYRIAVRLRSVLDISDPKIMSALGLNAGILADMDMRRCQEIGSSVERLEHDGLIVPSARTKGINLVIYPNRTAEDMYRFDITDVDIIDPGISW